MRTWLLAAALFLAAGGLFLFFPQSGDEKQNVSLKDMTIDIADSPEEQAQGLSGRAVVPHDYGMLFVFPEDGTPGFWMKDMLVPIDIIWITETGEIAGIERAVDPSTYPAVFYAPGPVRYVLEVAAGEAERKGIDIGDEVEGIIKYLHDEE